MINMRLLDKKQVSKMLECSVGKIDTAMRKREISYIKKGNKVRFKEEDVEAYAKKYLYRYVEALPQSPITKKIDMTPNGFDHWMGNLTREEKETLRKKLLN